MTLKKTPAQFLRPYYSLNLGSQILALGHDTKIMGIINTTPDSFSGDGSQNISRALRLAKQQIQEGADILDVGGESSRPGANAVSVKEEINRVIPLVKKLVQLNQVPISVDTYKLKTAQAALDHGATIINNIKGTLVNKNFLRMIRNYKAAIVLMHMRGTPKTMQMKTQYRNLIPDLLNDLKTTIENCLEIGIKSDKLIIDPGIGFAKTAEQNLLIIQRLQEFSKLKTPILVGVSRKSFIGKILNQKVEDRLSGSIAASVISTIYGAHILRVHDVRATKEAITIADAIVHQT